MIGICVRKAMPVIIWIQRPAFGFINMLRLPDIEEPAIGFLAQSLDLFAKM
ncbi:hypothetical protein D3C75_1313430 [compost metagenome]